RVSNHQVVMNPVLQIGMVLAHGDLLIEIQCERKPSRRVSRLAAALTHPFAHQERDRLERGLGCLRKRERRQQNCNQHATPPNVPCLMYSLPISLSRSTNA